MKPTVKAIGHEQVAGATVALLFNSTPLFLARWIELDATLLICYFAVI